MKKDNGSEKSSPLNSDSSKSATSAVDSSALPNSKKIYVSGKIHPDIRVPFREISLAPTKTMSGEIEINEPVRVYDTSGPWGDPSVTLDPIQGLPPLRRDWILKRGGVEEINGRVVQPIDDGYLSETHAVHAKSKRPTNASPARTAERGTSNGNDSNIKTGAARTSSFVIRHSSFAERKPLRAKPSNCVTQLAYARREIGRAS